MHRIIMNYIFLGVWKILCQIMLQAVKVELPQCRVLTPLD